jgi:DNA processing protein
MSAVLKRPLSEKERGSIVAMSRAGWGPARLAGALSSGDTIGEVTGSFAVEWRAMLSDLRRSEMRAIVPSDDEYPRLLRSIAAPPPLLYGKGDVLGASRPYVAIVGARACTIGAARFARRLGAAVSAAGFTVVSGLARGIDVAAHKGALEFGPTVAVLGTGLDICYPREHRDVAEQIVRRGALLSEFPPGLGPRAWHFPARNRIIAGMSVALIAVEAGMGSGALITVGFALDEGRDVYACTTGPDNPAGAGIRAMLLDGAQLIVDEEQAVEMLADAAGVSYPDFVPTTWLDPTEVLEGEHLQVYESITEGTTPDQIAALLDLPTARVSAVLAALELDGHVESFGSRWERAERT